MFSQYRNNNINMFNEYRSVSNNSSDEHEKAFIQFSNYVESERGRSRLKKVQYGGTMEDVLLSIKLEALYLEETTPPMKRYSSPTRDHCFHCAHDHNQSCCLYFYDTDVDKIMYSKWKSDLEEEKTHYVRNTVPKIPEALAGSTTPRHFPGFTYNNPEFIETRIGHYTDQNVSRIHANVNMASGGKKRWFRQFYYPLFAMDIIPTVSGIPMNHVYPNINNNAGSVLPPPPGAYLSTLPPPPPPEMRPLSSIPPPPIPKPPTQQPMPQSNQHYHHHHQQQQLHHQETTPKMCCNAHILVKQKAKDQHNHYYNNRYFHYHHYHYNNYNNHQTSQNSNNQNRQFIPTKFFYNQQTTATAYQSNNRKKSRKPHNQGVQQNYNNNRNKSNKKNRYYKNKNHNEDDYQQYGPRGTWNQHNQFSTNMIHEMPYNMYFY